MYEVDFNHRKSERCCCCQVLALGETEVPERTSSLVLESLGTREKIFVGVIPYQAEVPVISPCEDPCSLNHQAQRCILREVLPNNTKANSYTYMLGVANRFI